MNTHPLLIDNVAFAKKNEHLAGSLSIADCPRLTELLASQAPNGSLSADNKNTLQDSGVINFSLDGETNAIGQHFLHLTLSAALVTYCQRCLEQMPLSLNLSFDYLISDVHVSDVDAEMLEDDDEYDLQESSKTMDLLTLIEDEIIMAMPIAPTHAEHCTQAPMQSGEKPNPFAVLKGLIKS